MSSLFADAMRAAIYCNASGFGPAEPLPPAPTPPTCTSHLYWDCYGMDCELSPGHDGPHQYRDTATAAQDGEYRPVEVEFRWNEADV